MKKDNLKKIFNTILIASAVFPCAAALKEFFKSKTIENIESETKEQGEDDA